MTTDPPNEDSPEGQLLEAGFSATISSGPLPPPDVLERYAELIPSAGDRILTMAEQALAHDIHMETEGAKRASQGLIAGTTVALAALAVALVAILSGEPIVGGVIAGVDLVGLVGVYIYGTRPRP